jgi:pyruvate phosphate dikinase-like enzyme
MLETGKFRRTLIDPEAGWTWIGEGSIGGKASGLAAVHTLVSTLPKPESLAAIEINIPAFTVIRTGIFDAFIGRNRLREFVESGPPDDVIAQEFQKASLPAEVLGDLRSLTQQVRVPLALRSSSMLEDSLAQPFAGIYTTKMIPNNQPSPDTRFQKLLEAVKLIYASTFFKSARDYIRATGRLPDEEKMAVVVQEVVGQRIGDRFYPQVSGVARSYNFYPVGNARREDGVVSLALGLGKTIVDGDTCWTYSPERPTIAPPYNSFGELLEQTQTQFWAVNMGKPPAYDPIHETEYLVRPALSDAESDGALRYLASTYDAQSDRLVPGISVPGPRVLNFAGLLVLKEFPLNDAVKLLLDACKKAVGYPVEIEFAATFSPPRIGFLQVRPMNVSSEEVIITGEDLRSNDALLASERVMGNGVDNTMRDIVYVKPERFDPKYTPQIGSELEKINRDLLEQRRPYLLIGFGRWGSSDPWLGIPVNWGQISGARAIVEATQPSMNVDLSQGSHFFHNLISFSVSYFCVSYDGPYAIDWKWLSGQRTVAETDFVRHVALPSPLSAKVDGKTGRGVIRFLAYGRDPQ